MRTVLVTAAVIAALVIPIVAYREAPVPLATRPDRQPQDVEPIDTAIAMQDSECRTTMQAVEGSGTLIRLCANAR